jgi:hypothetical protein
MDSCRRRFLKMAGIAAVGLGTQPVIQAVASDASHGTQPSVRKGSKALLAKQWAMVIDTRKLQHEEDVEPLIEVCHAIHNVPHFENKNHEIKWIWETHYHNAFPDNANAHQSEEIHHRPFWSCATTARILPACGPARPMRPSSGKATASY